MVNLYFTSKAKAHSRIVPSSWVLGTQLSICCLCHMAVSSVSRDATHLMHRQQFCMRVKYYQGLPFSPSSSHSSIPLLVLQVSLLPSKCNPSTLPQISCSPAYLLENPMSAITPSLWGFKLPALQWYLLFIKIYIILESLPPYKTLPFSGYSLFYSFPQLWNK